MITLLLIVISIILFIVYNKKVYSYWKNNNLESYPINCWVLGNIPLTKSYISNLNSMYQYFKNRKQKHGGFYNLMKPVYMPINLDVIKTILTKDFENFDDKGVVVNDPKIDIANNVFTLGGNQWRKIRHKISPTFTSNKLKGMLSIIITNAEYFVKELETFAETGEKVDIRNFTNHYSTGIGSDVCFGIELNSFKNPHSEYLKYCKEIPRSSIWLIIMRCIRSGFPTLAKLLNMSVLPKEPANFFSNIIAKAMRVRKNYNEPRSDFLQLLLDSQESIELDKRLTDEEIRNQMFVILLALDSVSTVLTSILMEISRSPEIQQKMRRECNEVLQKHNNHISWESLSELRYLEQVIEESFRMYPTQSILMRACTKTFRVPDTDVVLQPGTKVYIPVYSIHSDSDYYPNPEVFDPERFSPEEKAKRDPYAFLPFGQGPRTCLGQRFSIIMLKTIILTIVKNYHLSLSEEVEYPVSFDNNMLALNISQTIYLKCTKVNS